MTSEYDSMDDNIKVCASKIQNGDVVIFPTETVYGIGANIYSESAIKKIYDLKQRPLNNPLIVHVFDWNDGKKYTDLNDLELSIIDYITAAFWPGPLSILVKKKNVPDYITANSDWVCLRSPSNPIARKLLEYSKVPIAAPSANISGKISSTDKNHVLDYFKDKDVSMLLDNTPSDIGVESSIIKVDNNTINMLRPGIITLDDLKKIIPNTVGDIVYTNSSPQEQCPGSDISHYTTDKKTFLFNFIDMNYLPKETLSTVDTDSLQKTTKKYLQQSACIDFNGLNVKYSDTFGAYVDISEKGDIHEAVFNIYNVLHQLNKIDNIQTILIFNIWEHQEGLYNVVYDRLYRCANGKSLVIPKLDI